MIFCECSALMAASLVSADSFIVSSSFFVAANFSCNYNKIDKRDGKFCPLVGVLRCNLITMKDPYRLI